jgi:hypothetical protein
MGLLSKLKKLLFDEEPDFNGETLKEEVVPKIKQEYNEEPKKIDPKKDEMEDVISERELFRSETTFKFPIIFEDEDFIAEKKQSKNTNVLNMETTKIREQINKESKEDVKKNLFRPSLIISPVYGVLDKNYQKEEILSKKQSETSIKSEKKIDFDAIHKKAYGTLSDVLESNIEAEDNKGMFFNLKEEETFTEDNLLYDMSEEDENVIIIEDITIAEPKNDYDDFGIDYVESKKEEPKEKNPYLFDLIDSMYDDKEEEE